MSKKKQVTLRLNQDHVDRINEWRERQQVPPSFAAAVDQAIEAFVEALDEKRPTIARGIDADVSLRVQVRALEDRLAALEAREGE